jgi:integrase/recombinase XerD
LARRDRPRPADPIITNRAGTRLTPNGLQRYLSRLYARAGLIGCSSHCGRRTFRTNAARIANQHACSLRDVQALAGHRFLSSTAPHLQPSPTLGALVRAL